MAAKAKTPDVNQAPAGAVSMARRARAANRWREQYNPLRNLSLTRAVGLIEAYPRGIMADLMWTYFFVEGADADLLAIIERRTSALLEMDWGVKQVSEKIGDQPRKGFDKNLADEQQTALREAYERISNLYEAIEHLEMAQFRGFAHAEKARMPDGTITHFEIVDQWNIVRDGLNGDWKYNADAQATTFDALPAGTLIDPAQFLIRVVRRPVNRIALIKFIRANLSMKDWDAFIEIYGIPGGVLIGPPNVPQGREADYELAAREIAEGGSGYAPHGSTYTPNDGPRGTNPFSEHLKYLTEQLVLAGTGGLLTMLTMSGSGTLAGGAHQETFEKIARADARRITEVFQRDLDREILTTNFPGKPQLAYFAIAANEEIDTQLIVEDALKLAQAGYQMDAAELSEKTGYNLKVRPPAPMKPPRSAQGGEQPQDEQVANRRTLRALLNRTGDMQTERYISKALQLVGNAVATDLQPLANRLEKVLEVPDSELPAALAKFQQDLPQLAGEIIADPPSAAEFAKVLGTALANGLAQSPEQKAAA